MHKQKCGQCCRLTYLVREMRTWRIGAKEYIGYINAPALILQGSVSALQRDISYLTDGHIYIQKTHGRTGGGRIGVEVASRLKNPLFTFRGLTGKYIISHEGNKFHLSSTLGFAAEGYFSVFLTFFHEKCLKLSCA